MNYNTTKPKIFKSKMTTTHSIHGLSQPPLWTSEHESRQYFRVQNT